jgi:hypothetical protein
MSWSLMLVKLCNWCGVSWFTITPIVNQSCVLNIWIFCALFFYVVECDIAVLAMSCSVIHLISWIILNGMSRYKFAPCSCLVQFFCFNTIINTFVALPYRVSYFSQGIVFLYLDGQCFVSWCQWISLVVLGMVVACFSDSSLLSNVYAYWLCYHIPSTCDDCVVMVCVCLL